MHTDGWNRPTLVFDLVEPFRAIVDQEVFFLFSKKRVHPESHFENTEQGRMLSKEGKQILMEAVRRSWKAGCQKGMEHLTAGFAKGLAEWTPKGDVRDDLVCYL